MTAEQFLGPRPQHEGVNLARVDDPPAAHDHDDRYYTEAEVDAKIGSGGGAGGGSSRVATLLKWGI